MWRRWSYRITEQTVEDGCDSLLMPVRGSAGDREPVQGCNRLPWENLLKISGG